MGGAGARQGGWRRTIPGLGPFSFPTITTSVPKAAWGRQIPTPPLKIPSIRILFHLCACHFDVEANTGAWFWRLEMHSVEGKGSTSMIMWIGVDWVIAISVASVRQCHAFLRCI